MRCGLSQAVKRTWKDARGATQQMRRIVLLQSPIGTRLLIGLGRNWLETRIQPVGRYGARKVYGGGLARESRSWISGSDNTASPFVFPCFRAVEKARTNTANSCA